MAEDSTNVWRMASIGMVFGAILAVVTGIVLADRSRDSRLAAPSASPHMTMDPNVAQAPAPPAAPPSASTSKGVPPQSVIAECNRVAGDMSGPERTRDEKITNAAKGAGVGAGAGTLYGIHDNKKHDERYRSAYIACVKAKGYTA